MHTERRISHNYENWWWSTVGLEEMGDDGGKRQHEHEMHSTPYVLPL